jgi:hypothetical protein
MADGEYATAVAAAAAAGAPNASAQIIYVNNSGVGFSGVDFQVNLGIKKDRTPGSPPKPEDTDLIVFMSPQHAKQLFLGFQQALQMYEELFGEINLTPSSEAMKKFPPMPMQV